MGKIILTVEGSTVGTVATGGGVVIEKAVSETDSGRLIAAYAKAYAGKWLDADGQLRQPTIVEVLDAWWDGVVAGSVATVLSIEQASAAEAARTAVTPINVT
jgi:hypothetical protein